MNNLEYRTLLGQLPIKSPTPEIMAQLCPHLTKEQAVKAFTTGSGYVACPSLRVRNAFHVVSYHKETVEDSKVSLFDDDGKVDVHVTGKKNHPARLDWYFASRTLKSYAKGNQRGGDFTKYKHMNEAMNFANDNWGSKLILDRWESVVEFYIQDPSELVNDRYHKDYPRTKAVLRVTLDRDLNEINNNRCRPQSEQFDQAIMEMTLDRLVWSELKGGRGGFTKFNCAFCGSGLGLRKCSGCGFAFKDDEMRCGWDTPLSPKMVDFLRQNGHTFAKDPEIALRKERDEWENNR